MGTRGAAENLSTPVERADSVAAGLVRFVARALARTVAAIGTIALVGLLAYVAASSASGYAADKSSPGVHTLPSRQPLTSAPPP